MVYSKKHSEAYCKYCVLFAKETARLKLNVFVRKPLQNGKKFTKRLALTKLTSITRTARWLLLTS